MDLEVIYSWKSYWHRLQGESMVAKYHAAKASGMGCPSLSAQRTTLHDALKWASYAWHHLLPSDIIRQGFKKAKILPTNDAQLDHDPAGELQNCLNELQNCINETRGAEEILSTQDVLQRDEQIGDADKTKKHCRDRV
jgi:hypothetical protein